MKIPRAMLWPLHAHTHTCTCTYMFVNKHTLKHACKPCTHAEICPVFIHLSNFWCLPNSLGSLELDSQLDRGAEHQDGTWPVSVMAFCLPQPREVEVWDGSDGETQTSRYILHTELPNLEQEEESRHNLVSSFLTPNLCCSLNFRNLACET